MFLSSTQDAIDSILCSAFFDPCVPCNLVGSTSLGIKKALFNRDGTRNEGLLRAIISEKPHLGLLWSGAICTGQAESLLRLALHNLPPLCLPAAFWTNTIQSFLQVRYHLESVPTESKTSRAQEFQISCFCRSNASIPWTPSPPFGSTPSTNLSLGVREHLEHDHKPRSWQLYWYTKSGVRIPASSRYSIHLPNTVSIQYPETQASYTK